MSLGIDIDKITAALLPDSNWYDVKIGTFNLNAYEFLANTDRPNGDFDILHGGGHSGICSTGFEFLTPDHDTIAGPLTNLIAVKYE